ncbi:hypothetical protein K3495_g10840 [Podosphaera aphanis]|nr:hypothetical protein K3495_g10840 [Podosphaera aphanis]
MKEPVTNDPPPLPAITQEAVARSVSSRHSHFNEPLLVKTKGRPKQAKAARRIPTALEFAQSQAKSTMQATAKKVVAKKTKKIDQLSQLITSVQSLAQNQEQLHQIVMLQQQPTQKRTRNENMIPIRHKLTVIDDQITI